MMTISLLLELIGFVGLIACHLFLMETISKDIKEIKESLKK